jgi:HK97 gp10 family phage protein
MAGKVNWLGNAYISGLAGEMKRRTSAASIRLSAGVKAEISQAGTLRYGKGSRSKQSKTIYNFTHSAPGNPPYKQTGRLRASITWELVPIGGGLVVIGRVGTNVKYARWLELGTSKMKARPFLRRTLIKYMPELRAILTKKIGGPGLPDIVSNQSRAGILGRGGKAAGFS